MPESFLGGKLNLQTPPLRMPDEPPPGSREFFDSATARTGIYRSVLNAARAMPALTNRLHSLRLADVDYADPEDRSLADEKQAVLSGGTLSRRLRGTWKLLDNATGEVLDQKTQTIARVPHMTRRGTFVHNGSEYTLANQLRLRPGIFCRVKENGELEAHVNILPGEGPSHRYFLDPEKGVFYLQLGQAKMPLLPLLRGLGATDDQFREAWGQNLLAANHGLDTSAAVDKIMSRFLRTSELEQNPRDRLQTLRQTFSRMRPDPAVMQKTLGKPYKALDPDAILAATKKLLAITRGEAAPDDRDNLAFQTVFGPEELFAERLLKDWGKLRRSMFMRASFQRALKAIPHAPLTRQLVSVLLGSGLGQSAEEINSLEILDKMTRVTRMGEGGIGSIDAIPDEARATQPSHAGFIDPIRTPESLRAGVDVYFTRAARKADNGEIYAPFRDVRSGHTVWKSPREVADSVLAFPGELKKPGGYAKAFRTGNLQYVPKAQVELEPLNFEDAFSPLGNLVPFKSASKGQRVAMGSRMITQALPLQDAEAPWVQAGIPGQPGRSYEDEYGKYAGAIFSTRRARVVSVEEEAIRLRGADGTEESVELYVNRPHNRKTVTHQTPAVQPGDIVEPGQLLARSNMTDAAGSVALGKNVRVAWIPWQGKNFEDAVVISDSLAKKTLSEHLYQQRVEWDEQLRKGKNDFLSLLPTRYKKQLLDRMDADGVVKPGTILHFGDPVILAAREREGGYNRVHKRGSRSFVDASETWEHHVPGTVIDVVKTERGITVSAKAYEPTLTGDKLSGRHGNKGVVAAVLPDDQMPHDAEGKPFEMLLNPLGLISRTNASQAIETVLGKIAAKTGKPYKVADFENIDDLTTFAEDELKKHGMRDTEDILDPTSGRKIPDILTGSVYVMKLQHTAESKEQGRGTGGYTAMDEPAKGGATGAKRLGMLEANAVLSYGAPAVLRDASLIRGQRNEPFWAEFLQGKAPTEPAVPLVYRKFISDLRASGINVVADGPQLHVLAMTNDDVKRLSGNREIKKPETVSFDQGMRPVPGGLFDPALTGGNSGQRWSYIGLAEPMLNPVMEEPARRLLGLTQKQLEEVIAGRLNIPAGTGPEGLKRALEHINVPQEIEKARAAIAGSRKTARDAAVKKLGYLKACENFGIQPGSWVLDRVPVLPPIFRPISVIGPRRLPMVADPNYLYIELMRANEHLADLKTQVSDVGDERASVYGALKAVMGLADPLHPKLQEKRVRGILAEVFGSSPKHGVVQRRLLASSVDLTGRAVVIPDPDLDMDQCAIPEERAWEVYRNFVVRRLRQRGMPVLEAARQVRDRSDLARREMLEIMGERPVLISRAPVLHKFGVIALWPKITKDHALHVNPFITGPMGMDFDGDTSNYHVPVSDDAVQQAVERMLPSRNLLSPSDFKTPAFQPTQEYTGGLYAATSPAAAGKRTQSFATKKDAIAAYRRGEIGINDPIKILS